MITTEQLLNRGVKMISDMYYDQENSGGQFADDLVEDMEKYFSEPRDISLIMNTIQEFRSWDAEDDSEDEIEIEAEVEMMDVDNKGYEENMFNDFMYSNHEYVPRGTRIGVEIDDVLELDEGIYYADVGRR